MSTATPTDVLAEVETLADLLARLGDVPLERVRFRPLPGTATEQDVIAARKAGDRRRCELVDGVLVEKPMGTQAALVASLIVYYLWEYLETHDLGIVLGGDGLIRLWPGRVRIPDVAYFSWERLPGGELPDDPIARVVPDLAVEVLSKSNTPKEIAQKLHDYFHAGTKLAWVVDPKTRTARIYTSADEVRSVGKNGRLVGGDVLPGLSIPLQKVLSRTRRKG